MVIVIVLVTKDALKDDDCIVYLYHYQFINTIRLEILMPLLLLILMIL